jgi:murein L,D-transpeptidase YcbB/YkuD
MSRGVGTGTVLVSALLTVSIALQSFRPSQDKRSDTPTMRAHHQSALGDTGFLLTLNLPAFRLDVRQGDEFVRTYRVAVGMPKYPTPRGSFSVTHIEWNPWWIPPDRAWARRERVTPPGPKNPMGKVKLHFRPLYFLHGTAVVSSIGTAASHGCIRMRNEDAVDLALLVHVSGGSPLPNETLDSLLRGRATRVVELARPVPLAIDYRLVEVRGDSLLFHPNIYRLRDWRVADALVALAWAGLDTTSIRRPLLDRAARESRRSPGSIPIDSLVPR